MIKFYDVYTKDGVYIRTTTAVAASKYRDEGYIITTEKGDFFRDRLIFVNTSTNTEKGM